MSKMPGDEIKCICCGMTFKLYREMYPFQATIVASNAYRLPVGKQFPFARLKEGDASPYPVIIVGNWPSFFHGRVYQMKRSEVSIKTHIEVDDE